MKRQAYTLEIISCNVIFRTNIARRKAATQIFRIDEISFLVNKEVTITLEVVKLSRYPQNYVNGVKKNTEAFNEVAVGVHLISTSPFTQ